MTNLDTETSGTTRGAQRVLDSAARLVFIHGLGLVFCPSLPTPVHTQAATASREARTTLKGSKTCQS